MAIDALLMAWGRLPAVKRQLVLVGDGPDRGRLRDLSSQLSGDCVRFDGCKTNILQYLHAADVFVLPSRHEGLSVSLLEAAAAGLPLLASDIPANREIVKDNINGFLFEPGEVDDLQLHMERLLHSPDLRKKMGAASRHVAEQSYALEAIVKKHRDLYDKVLMGSDLPLGLNV